MTTTGRGKVFRRKMWAVLHPQYLPSVHSSGATADYLLHKCGSRHLGRVIPVLVTEIRAGRGGKRGK